MVHSSGSLSRKILYNKNILLVIITILLLFFIGILILEYQQWEKRRAINAEIKDLQTTEQRLELEKQNLVTSLQELQNPEVKERLARQQLNLKRDGEILVNLPKENLDAIENQATNEKRYTNLKAWVNYFFKQ